MDGYAAREWLNGRDGLFRWLWHAAAVIITVPLRLPRVVLLPIDGVLDSVACVRKWVDCDWAKMFAGPWLDPAVWLAIGLYLGLDGRPTRLGDWRWEVAKRGRRSAWGGLGACGSRPRLAALIAPTGAKSPFIYFQF